MEDNQGIEIAWVELFRMPRVAMSSHSLKSEVNSMPSVDKLRCYIPIFPLKDLDEEDNQTPNLDYLNHSELYV